MGKVLPLDVVTSDLAFTALLSLAKPSRTLCKLCWTAWAIICSEMPSYLRSEQIGRTIIPV